METKFVEFIPFDNLGIAIQFGMMFECPHCLKHMWFRPDQIKASTTGKCHYCLRDVEIDKTKIPKLSIGKQSKLIHDYFNGKYLRVYDGEHCRLIERVEK